MKFLSKFKEVWAVDFEFNQVDGDNPEPICLVAHEYKSGKIIRKWLYEKSDIECPYSLNSNTLFVSFYSIAELSCHLALDWDMPCNNLDLFVEFKNLTNGRVLRTGRNLIGALTFFGLDVMSSVEKEEMRGLAIRGGPFTQQEKESLLEYCESDAISLIKLFDIMSFRIDIDRALLRGQSMKALTHIEHSGIPIDKQYFKKISRNWEEIKLSLIEEIDKNYNVFDGTRFVYDKWEKYIHKNTIDWPLLDSGKLKMDKDTFREMAKVYPGRVKPIKELRQALSELRLTKLAVGRDDRNRCMLSPFRSKTGRNQPSNSKYIFGFSSWLRGLIKPSRGNAIAYIDWGQQEFGIAAALSGDKNMQVAYKSGDPYLFFAKQSGAVPESATKKSHSNERSLFKQCILATQYGMGAKSLALRINKPLPYAENLLELHRRTFPIFWNWSDSVVDYTALFGNLFTVFGWNIFYDTDSNIRSIRNFPMQANGAEMLRLACCFIVESRMKLCATIHDAILIEAPIDSIDEAVKQAQKMMTEASRIILNGFELKTDVKVFKYPERYSETKGRSMWELVNKIVTTLE